MSQEKLQNLLAQIKGNTALQNNLRSADTAEAVMTIAEQAGCPISSQELSTGGVEVTEREKESLAGGRVGCYNATMAPPTDDGTCGKTGMWICQKQGRKAN